MRCAVPATFWAYAASDGASLVQVDGLVVGAEGAGCTGSQYVVVTQAEFDAATVSPFRLSLDEAGAISAAILGVWAIGWAIRTLVRVLRHVDADQGIEG